MNEQAPVFPYAVLTAHRGLTEIKGLLHLVNTSGGFVGGGYARYCLSPLPKPLAPSDVDIFCKVESVYQYLPEEIVRRGGKVVFTTPNAVTIQPPEAWRSCPKIQIISPTIWLGDAWSVISQFDFTVSSAALTWEDQGIAHKEFEDHEYRQLLVVNKMQCPIGTLKRAMKYSKKGYKLSSTEMLKFYSAWEGLAPEKKEELIQIINVPHQERSPEDRETYRRLVYID